MRIALKLCTFLAVLATAATAPADTAWTNALGDNLWSESGNWSGGQPDGFEDVTIFPAVVPGSGVITLDSGEFVDELRFDGGGYTLTGGDLYLLSGKITANGGGSNPTIASEVQGLGGLTKLGNRPLNLQGDNTYSGVTDILESALDVSGASERLPDGTTVIVNAGTSLRFFLGAGTETVGSLIGTGEVAFGNTDPGGTDLRVGASNVDHVFEGNLIDAFGGTGKLTKVGSGRLTLTGANAYSGGTEVGDGELVVDAATLPASGGVVNDASLIFDQASDGAYAGVISGGGSLVKQGAGVLTLNQTNSYTGGTRLDAGVVAISDEENLGAETSGVLFAGGTLRVLDDEFAFFVPATAMGIAVGSDARFDLEQDAIAIVGAGVSGAGGLVKEGPGLLVLEGASTYTGPTTINAGTLLFSGVGEVIPGGSAVTVQAGATFVLDHGNLETIGSLSGAGTVELHSSLSLDGHLRVGADNTSTTFSGDLIEIMGPGYGRLTKIGLGTLTLTGENHYNGATKVEGGLLVVDTDSLPANGGVESDSTLVFDQGFDGVYAGVISGAGQVSKLGSGVLALDQENTFSGGLTIFGGAVFADGVGATGSGPVQVNDGGTLGGTGSVGGSVTLASGATLAPGASAGSLAIGGDLDLQAGATLAIEIGGTTSGDDYDRVEVDGFATLLGDLDVTLIDSFTPSAGDSFAFLFASGGFNQAFANVNLPDLSPENLEWFLNPGGATLFLEVVATAIDGDYNADGTVNAADYTVWRDNLGAPAGTLPNDSAGGTIGPAHYTLWKTNFGATLPQPDALASSQVPEPGTCLLLTLFAFVTTYCYHRQRR